ncbi:DUF4244 domain-containing protein [Alloscardovia venturai]|uniref:DUF4244 domain-containing protein n=1 Tax=Alloscardovia venturai TaxID=1769421 RepID=A0ABW2Y279_9BIFI
MKKRINELVLHAMTRCSTALNKWKEKVSTDDPGMATAEYAVVLVAATSFAAVLVAILKSEAVRQILTKLVTDALSVVS